MVFAALTAAGAFIRLPFRPFQPTTLQVFFVLLSGVVLGSRLGAASQLTFIFLGFLGLPYFNVLADVMPLPHIFASPDFIHYQLPMGYLIGFIAASFLAGYVSRAPEVNFLGIFGGMLLAAFLIYEFAFVFFLILRIPGFNWNSVKSAAGFFGMDIFKCLGAAYLAYQLRSLNLEAPEPASP